MLLFVAFRKHVTSRGPWPLCDSPDTPTEWKSESVTYQLTGVDARDAYASKNTVGF